jgi:hypothetical protein
MRKESMMCPAYGLMVNFNYCQGKGKCDSCKVNISSKKPHRKVDYSKYDYNDENYVPGVPNITVTLKQNHPILKDISEKTVHRHLDSGKLPSESREPHRRFRIHVNSSNNIIGPDCDLEGYQEIADYIEYSPRHTKRLVEDEKIPVDWFGNRVFSTQSSLAIHRKYKK